MTQLLAGWARKDITPPVGIHMGGYWGRRSGAVGVHDDLDVRVVLWATSPQRAVALVTLDLVAVTAAMAARLRKAVVEAAAPHVTLSEAAISICCSHTHAGPLSIPFRGMGEVDEGYLERVCAQTAACARKAAQSLAPTTMWYDRVPVQIGINRRQGRPGAVAIGVNPDGPVAAHAHVVTMAAGEARAVLFQHACHPVVLGNGNHEISADFPGAARRVVEARTGALAVFVNGAAGDINPRATAGSFADVEALGGELGEAVANAGPGTPIAAEGGLTWSHERLELPLEAPPAALRATLEQALQELKTAVRTAGADAWARRVPQAQLAWSRELLALAHEPSQPRTQPFEVQALRIGGVSLLALEGEIFVRYQLDLEAVSPTPLLVCGFANGCIGYVPTADEYARGGYEVEQAYKVYPSVLMIAPQSEALIRAAAKRVLAAAR